MKIRQGFVSNSSSSSFVIAGFKLSQESFDKLADDLRDKIEEELHITNLWEQDEVIVGFHINGCSSDDCLETKCSSIQDINDMIEKTRSYLDGVEVLQEGLFSGEA